ncbi:very-long-chain (3R)-3-hydroxyacyl-CoA dehydratase 2-like [Oscarella lobularis]|uniref:very-long-chain (3R)-3-hydroxyacyl-CoA dehydratase 2-like n=1 Tax=Oscarella lobularis TaxID=121494 RepID=UPI003313F937
MSAAAKVYLLAYNGFLVLGWTFVLYRGLLHYASSPSLKEFYNDLYSAVEQPLKVSQTLAVLEILHAMLGLVRSGVMLTFFQVFSRETLLWFVASAGGPKIQSHYGFAMMVLAWTISEIIRYSFYFFNIIHRTPYILTWCRYTFFIVLYPTGVAGELLLIGNMMPIAQETGIFSYRLPNKWNISFDFFTFLCVAVLLYVPVFPQLYGHMLKQRRKIIGGGGNVDKKD